PPRLRLGDPRSGGAGAIDRCHRRRRESALSDRGGEEHEHMSPQLLQPGGADLLRAAGAAQPPGQAVLVPEQVGGGAVALELERVCQIDGQLSGVLASGLHWQLMVYRRKSIVDGDTSAPRRGAPRATPTAGGRSRSGSAPWPVDEEYAHDDGGEAEQEQATARLAEEQDGEQG